MANNNKPKPTKIEKEIKTYNPTKSKVGRIIIVLLAGGMFIGIIIAAIINIINSFS
ncbi:MAG: hypothetical protein WC251_02835 [Candidatus Izemoplasmatales bacterium]|jgi:hypothetical protein|nr:hypothetical protein [Candidatus Izemoplasmatales bacterium]